MPDGGSGAVTACGLLCPFRKAGLWAQKSCTLPSRAAAWPSLEANLAGTTSGSPAPESRERTLPSGQSGIAPGAPYWDSLQTRTRCASRIRPGWV